ncbi:hypothetical protein VTL71DRAFT_7724 [Oculimacula yallundae]|uniref:Uncharacterized protein n=1 Tax=Oculimacula yallundae TaxID=86028 RepID=A0ABR4BV03_9HELO
MALASMPMYDPNDASWTFPELEFQAPNLDQFQGFDNTSVLGGGRNAQHDILPDRSLHINQQMARANIPAEPYIFEDVDGWLVPEQALIPPSSGQDTSSQSLGVTPPGSGWCIAPRQEKSVPCIKFWFDKKRACSKDSFYSGLCDE